MVPPRRPGRGGGRSGRAPGGARSCPGGPGGPPLAVREGETINGLTNVVSTNGGASWSLAAGQPQFSTCSGAPSGSPGDFNRATDPWVAFSADGQVAYSISDSFNANGPAFGGASSIIISRSTDGGNHWQTPVTAELDTSNLVLNDKESITADPFNAKAAYAVWDRLVSPQSNANPSAFIHSIAFRGPALFSRTTDKGVTWSQGRIIFDPGEKDQTIGNQIVIPTTGPASGVLIDGISLITNKGGKCPFTHGGAHCAGSMTFTASVLRSTDGGNTSPTPSASTSSRSPESRSPARPCARATSRRSSPRTP